MQAKCFDLQRELTDVKRKQTNPLAYLDPTLTQSMSTQHLNHKINKMLEK